MRIAVFSDSHKKVGGMVRAVDLEHPDVIFHLGDHQTDADKLHECFPDIPMYSVYGNCDLITRGESRIIVELAGKKIFAAHGHTYSVKLGLNSIINTAMTSGSDIVLFGHTHRALNTEYEGLIIMNPGASGLTGTYGMIIIKDGKVIHEIRDIPME